MKYSKAEVHCKTHILFICTVARTAQVLGVLIVPATCRISWGQGFHPRLYRHRAGGPARGLYRGPHGQRFFQ